MGIVGSLPAMGTGEQASHEQVWSVTLALATIKGMVDRPNDRSIQVCEELDPSPPSCYAAAPTSWWLWSPADAVSIWAVWVVGYVMVCIVSIPMLPLLYHASQELNGDNCCMA